MYYIIHDDTSAPESSSDAIGGLSDGYHTFDDLYEHRITLYIALCKTMANKRYYGSDGNRQLGVWKSRRHSDGSVWDGWYLLGIFSEPGEQITYHLPTSRWDACDFAQEVDAAPPFDGHTSSDVLQRISNL